jgi:hypothetical protein
MTFFRTIKKKFKILKHNPEIGQNVKKCIVKSKVKICSKFRKGGVSVFHQQR